MANNQWQPQASLYTVPGIQLLKYNHILKLNFKVVATAASYNLEIRIVKSFFLDQRLCIVVHCISEIRIATDPNYWR